jgi:hypothetical protein
LLTIARLENLDETFRISQRFQPLKRSRITIISIEIWWYREGPVPERNHERRKHEIKCWPPTGNTPHSSATRDNSRQNQAQSVRDDIERIKTHPLVPDDIAVFGYIFDVKAGNLIEV